MGVGTDNKRCGISVGRQGTNAKGQRSVGFNVRIGCRSINWTQGTGNKTESKLK